MNYIESAYHLKFVSSSPFLDITSYGFECIETNRNCIGETRDALYWTLDDRALKFDEQSFYLLVGVNHANTKQSEYASITLYDVEKGSEETKGDLSNLDLNGTALLLPVDTNVNEKYLENMWIAQLSRPDNCIYDGNDELLIPG